MAGFAHWHHVEPKRWNAYEDEAMAAKSRLWHWFSPFPGTAAPDDSNQVSNQEQAGAAVNSNTTAQLGTDLNSNSAAQLGTDAPKATVPSDSDADSGDDATATAKQKTGTDTSKRTMPPTARMVEATPDEKSPNSSQ
jgi:hypothetical protein